MNTEKGGAGATGVKASRQRERQRLIAEQVLREGSVRIEVLAEDYDISLMTIHRDLDELETRGLLRKSRGWATAMSSSLVEASDVFRRDQQSAEKDALARAALEFIAPGQSVFLDDSTTTARFAALLPQKAPLTVVTNYFSLMESLRTERDVTVLGLGGRYVSWSDSFMGSMTTTAIRSVAADVFVMSTSAIIDDTCYHHTQDIVDVKRAMFDSAAVRILAVDHTKFERRALHALVRLNEFDHVIVDDGLSPERLARLRETTRDLTVARVRG
ncbi:MULTISPECIES: DeoR/GlpR family DNA-binding transcription regulator [Microbacterium]|uniref:DeoR/GlpR family DNA-binding transcription regulator n=1 Tax=Microbacterium TaxID=33882 RepID=UPI0027D7E71D|nr:MULTISPECIES: DeoR/GlpR family DNA-binding transcription regulator [Microbacterium]